MNKLPSQRIKELGDKLFMNLPVGDTEGMAGLFNRLWARIEGVIQYLDEQSKPQEGCDAGCEDYIENGKCVIHTAKPQEKECNKCDDYKHHHE